MTETNDKKIAHRTVMDIMRRAKTIKARLTIHSLDHFRDTKQSEIQSDEGDR